ncbi:MAG: outer membrane beta-barrel protein, partial [Leadbetterella sp.]|nr:outer membrane beta-barrel protein [Leadbetterella sp.]
EKILTEGRETVSLVSSADRYFNFLKSNLKISFNGSEAGFKNKVNGSEWREVATRHLLYGWESRSAFPSFFNYHAGSRRVKNRIRTETVNSFTDRVTFLDLDFRINRQWNIKVQTERYYFGRSKEACYFMDLEARYDLIRNKLTLYLFGNNLFNTKTFRNYAVSDISVTRTEYRLQPRFLLLKAEYRF